MCPAWASFLSPDVRPASVSFQHKDQRVTLITLGVSDYHRAEAFYAALGWRQALDLDGHAWEIAHNPGFGLDDQGNIVLPGA
jgi:hypothetical protein